MTRFYESLYKLFLSFLSFILTYWFDILSDYFPFTFNFYCFSIPMFLSIAIIPSFLMPPKSLLPLILLICFGNAELGYVSLHLFYLFVSTFILLLELLFKLAFLSNSLLFREALEAYSVSYLAPIDIRLLLLTPSFTFKESLPYYI